jgi:hypothetical protein
MNMNDFFSIASRVKRNFVYLNFCRRIGVASFLGTCLFLQSSVAMADDMKLEPSSALACLNLLPGAPAQVMYPASLLERKEGATVEVELEFRGADRAPKVKVLNEVGNYEFVSAVKEFVAQMRVPCMEENQTPVTLRQKYVFDPLGARKVFPSVAVDLADAERKAQIKCLVHKEPGTTPVYSPYSRRHEEQGVVIARLRFYAPDQAPTLEMLGSTEHRELKKSVSNYVEGLRLPCMTSAPIDTKIIYKFIISGGSRVLLRDTSLLSLLANSKDLSVPAKFDFNAMNCPFEVRVTYYRPFDKNLVVELDNSHPDRQEFLRWMSGITLKLDGAQANRVLGDSMTVSVPCGKLDL